MITITVTQDHIDKGKRLRSRECPLALALSEALGRTVLVAVSSFEFQGVVPVREYPLPDTAIAFRRLFDRGETVEPFTFEIADPRE